VENEIEIKLVLDQAQLKGPTALQLAEMFKQIAGNEAFGNAVEQVFRDRSSNDLIRELMDVPDRGELDDYKYDIINSSDFEESVHASVDSYIHNSDLHYLPDTVSDLQDTVEEVDGKWDSFVGEIGDRLDTIEDKLGTDWSEEDNREISRLQERVDKLEEINKRLFHIIHNIQGVKLT
tara:strand:+ start:20753 stop:21286 length:534 start_codon:yes stop_codon:yes gene_type:complete